MKDFLVFNYLGAEIGYSYRKLSELSFGLNFILMPNWQKKGVIYSCSYNGLFLFNKNYAHFGHRVNLDFVLWKRNNRTGLLFPNIGTYIENYNKTYNTGFRLGINFCTFIFINYQYTLPIVKKNDLISNHNIGLIIKFNSIIIDAGYYYSEDD